MAYRTFWTADGRQWEVWDVDSAAGSARLPEALPGGWLCFATDGEKRRLHPRPDAWDACSDAELEALQAKADAVRPRPARQETA
jgi:hypothetical protein